MAGDGGHRRHRRMRPRDARHRGLKAPVVTLKTNQLGTAGVELRCIRLVNNDVGFFVAEDATPGRCEECQRQGIGDGARAYLQYGDVGFKDLAKPLFEGKGKSVTTIGIDTTGT